MVKKESLKLEQSELNANIGEHIGFELGCKMAKDYYDQTGDEKSHFIGKNILVKILSQPDCIGVKVYKALNESGNQTYVLVGMDSAGKPILEYDTVNVAGELSKETGIVADRVIDDNFGWITFK